MAKMSAINKNNRRIKLSKKFFKKREKLKKIIMILEVLTNQVLINLEITPLELKSTLYFLR